MHSEYFKCSNWKEWKLLFWKTKISHWQKRKRDSENNWMIDWEINTAHYCLFKQLGALNKVFLISLLWWLTSFFTLKNHSWNSRMNWFLPTIINYSTSNCRKLLIFPTLHLQNSGLILPPFISCPVLVNTASVRMIKCLLLAFFIYKESKIYHPVSLPQEKESGWVWVLKKELKKQHGKKYSVWFKKHSQVFWCLQ